MPTASSVRFIASGIESQRAGNRKACSRVDDCQGRVDTAGVYIDGMRDPVKRAGLFKIWQ
jgi:hypothetical protein